MKSLNVLDVTLRDGGCVNNFNFGQDYMERILDSLEKSHVEIVELGYIDQNKGTEKERTQYCDEQIIKKHLLKNKKENTTYVVMMDYGKFDADKLHNREDDDIDGIRVAFHKKDRKEIVNVGRKIIEKGYKLFIQPMLTLRYSDAELIEFIEMVNQELPDAEAFYIVDSFGEMRPNDMNRVLNLVDNNLLSTIKLGFHSHNNLQMSYSNAVSMLQFPTNREMILDCSVLGMGKGAGNLNTELLLEHLNLFYGKSYNTEPLLQLIDQVINPIRTEFYWGYAIEYYLSAINHCTPSYAAHFYNKHMLPIDQVAELLGMIREDKKISFDKEYAEQLYFEYNARTKLSDEEVIRSMTEEISRKTVLLIAPGKTISEYGDAIKEELQKPNTVSISLNIWKEFDTDYVFVTRKDLFEKVLNDGKQIITSSSISNNTYDNVKTIDYKKWVVVEDGVQDSSGIMVLNMLQACKADKIILAGFDGFHVNPNKNYFNKAMNNSISVEQAEKRNNYFKKYINRYRRNTKVEFLTPSLYEE